MVRNDSHQKEAILDSKVKEVEFAYKKAQSKFKELDSLKSSEDLLRFIASLLVDLNFKVELININKNER